MIVDLKDKWIFLFSLFPLLIWSILLENYSSHFLFFAILSAIFTGYNLALFDLIDNLHKNSKTDPLEYARKIKKSIDSPMHWLIICFQVIFGLFSLIYFNFFMFLNITAAKYYQWVLFFLMWATIFYFVFIVILLLLDPEKRVSIFYLFSHARKFNEMLDKKE